MVLGHHRKQRMGGLRCMLLQLLVLGGGYTRLHEARGGASHYGLATSLAHAQEMLSLSDTVAPSPAAARSKAPKDKAKS